MAPSIDTHFKFITDNLSQSAADSRANFAKETAGGALNARMTGLVMTTMDMLVQDIDTLSTISRWITLSIPKIEDGNNFGVDIQMQLAKHVDDQVKVLVAKRDSLSDYYKDRAAALEKVLPSVTKKTDSSKKTSSNTGSAVKEDAQGETVSTSSGEDESTSTPSVLADSAEYVIQIELKWYYKLKDAAVTSMDILMVVLDAVEKNKEKIDNPRGSSGGGGGFSMY